MTNPPFCNAQVLLGSRSTGPGIHMASEALLPWMKGRGSGQLGTSYCPPRRTMVGNSVPATKPPLDSSCLWSEAGHPTKYALIC
jgi:hypothetical protein